MARSSWIDDDHHPAIDEHVQRLEHFTAALADGVVDQDELAKQEANLIAAMRDVEADLSDAQHTKVTRLLAELAAYTVMELLHNMAASRLRQVIK